MRRRRRRGAEAAAAAGTGARAAAVVVVVAGALALAAAASEWMPQGHDSSDSGLRCGGGGGGGGAPAAQCAAAQGARMSIAVSLADDVLVMGEGGVHLRGTAVVSGYDPREGHMFQEIRAEPSGRVVSKSKIFPRIGAGGEWAAQVGATLAPETYPPGSYSIGAVTESGLRSPRAGFAVSGGPAEAGGAPPPPPTPPPPPRPPAEAGTGLPAEPGPIGGAALGDAVEMVRAAPAEAARIDPPRELPGLPGLSDLGDAVQSVLPDTPPEPAPAPAPARPPSAAPEQAASPGAARPPSSAREAPAGAPAPQPGAGDGLLGYLAGLLTAGYLVTIVLSAIISLFVMMAIRYAMRRARRRRAARRP